MRSDNWIERGPPIWYSELKPPPAVEFSPFAHAWAAKNLVPLGVILVLGDLRNDFPELNGTVDVVVSNPPYIADGEAASLPASVRDWEPAVAAGPDGAAYIAWDTYDKGNYDVQFRSYQSGKLSPLQPLTSSPKFQAHATIAVTDGATTTIPLAYSAPQFFGAPSFAWLSFLPDISLDPLASGGSVLVTIDQTPTKAEEAVFPGQKGPAPHFGPFHISAGDTFEAQCLITASG